MSTSFFCLCHLRSSSAKMHMMWAGTVTLFSTESCLAGGGGLLLLTCVSSGAPAVGQTQEHNVQTQKSRVGWLKKTCRFLHSLSDYCLFVVLSPLLTSAWICQCHPRRRVLRRRRDVLPLLLALRSVPSTIHLPSSPFFLVMASPPPLPLWIGCHYRWSVPKTVTAARHQLLLWSTRKVRQTTSAFCILLGEIALQSKQLWACRSHGRSRHRENA